MVEERPAEEAERRCRENLKLVPYILWRYYPALAQDEDYYQEGCIGLWRACCRYSEDRGKFSTFAGACIRNAVGAAVQKRHRKRRWAPGGAVSLDAPLYKDGDAAVEDAIADPDASAFEFSVLAADLLGRLGERDRQILAMKYAGLSHKEISARLGRSQSYVSYQIKRIRAALGYPKGK